MWFNALPILLWKFKKKDASNLCTYLHDTMFCNDCMRMLKSAATAISIGFCVLIAFLASSHVLLAQSGESLHWRHNDHDGVSNHQPHGCLLNRLFRRRSKKTLKLRVTGLCAGNSPGPVNSPHKGPVMRKMVPFDDVIMMLIKSDWDPMPQQKIVARWSLNLHVLLAVISGGSSDQSIIQSPRLSVVGCYVTWIGLIG